MTHRERFLDELSRNRFPQDDWKIALKAIADAVTSIADCMESTSVARDINVPSKKVGKWILVDGIDEHAMARVRYIYCSNCGRQGLSDWRGNDCRSNYCPNCGATMGGNANDP